MILSLQAFAPAALLLAGGLWLLVRPGASAFVVVQALALAALGRLWQLAASTIVVPVYNPLPDVPLFLHIDHLSLFFATTAVAAALLLSLSSVGDRSQQLPYGWLALAEFGAVGAMLAGDLPGLAVGWGAAVAALFLLVLMPNPRGGDLRRPSEAVTRTLVLHLGAAALLLAGAVGVEALAGTASYDAIPVGALDTRTGLLLAASPVLVLATLAGLVRACRQPVAAALMVCAVLLPMAVYVLARSIDLAEGRPLPAPVNTTLLLLGGLGAMLLALYALWAPDLGSTLARLLNALGLGLVAAFGIGGPGGFVALIVGFLSLEVVAAASLLLLDAGRGRLPGRGPLPRGAVAALALAPLVAVGGAGLGLGVDSRLLVVRRLFDQGPRGVLLSVPLMVAMLLVGAGAVAAGRFGGGVLDGPRRAMQAVVAAALLVGAELSAPWLLDRVASLAAEATHAPAADVRSIVNASTLGATVGAGIMVAAVLAVAVAAMLPGFYSPVEGLRSAPDLLPPRIAVTPEIALRAAIAGAARRRAVVVEGFRPHARWVLLAGWFAAVGAVFLGSR